MTHEINNGKTKIGCLETNCKRGEIKVEEVRKIVNEELYQKFIRYTTAKSVFLSKNLKWCPKPDCNTICKVRSKSSASKTTCPKCQEEFCSKCSQNWTEHPRECNIYSNEITTQDLNVQACPGCQVPIQRQGGCYVVLCSFCTTIFCWNCLTKITHCKCNGNGNGNGHGACFRISLSIVSGTIAIAVGVLMFVTPITIMSLLFMSIVCPSALIIYMLACVM